ncbi:CsgG/HfaB family protein [Planctomicrobium sp. SH661]|uniref:CsgG/HfaB family protein n=1 Tax=Planctomicrobium sp. SH661 TaxID=3448124 RepID=UPI003F5C54CD
MSFLPASLFAETPTEKTPRIAVIAIGSGDDQTAKVLDLLQLELGKDPKLQILERTTLEQVLQEQSLVAAFGKKTDAQQAFELGRLISAELLLLVESIEEKQRSAPAGGNAPGSQVILRLLDTKHGFKLAEDFQSLAEPEALEDHARALAAWASTNASKLESIHEPRHVVAISSVTSDEHSSTWNWISDILPAGLERQLGRHPKIILAERHRVAPLLLERSVTTDLPESILPSAVFFQGHFQLEREKGLDAVLVTLEGRQKGSQLFEVQVRGSFNKLDQLSADLAMAVTEKLDLGESFQHLDATAETALLISQARWLIRAGQPERAIPLLESAVALDPKNIVPKMLIVHASHSAYFTFCRWTHPAHVNKTLRSSKSWRYDEQILNLVPMMIRNLNLCSQVMDDLKIRDGQFQHDQFFQEFGFANIEFSSLQDCLAYPQFLTHKADEHPLVEQAIGQMQPLLRECSQKIFERFNQYSSALHFSEEGFIHLACWKWDTPEEYLQELLQLLEKHAKTRFRNIDHLHFIIETRTKWRDRQDLHDVYLTFLSRLAEHPDVAIRAIGEATLVKYCIDAIGQTQRTTSTDYLEEYRLASQLALMRMVGKPEVAGGEHNAELGNQIALEASQHHFRRYLELLIQDLEQPQSELYPIINGKFHELTHPNVKIDDIEQGRLYERFVRAQLPHIRAQGYLIPIPFGFKRFNFPTGGLTLAVKYLEKGGDPASAERLLEDVLKLDLRREERTPLNVTLNELRSRHLTTLKAINPDFTFQPPVLKYRPEIREVLDRKQVNDKFQIRELERYRGNSSGGAQFRGIVRTDTGLAIIVSGSNGISSHSRNLLICDVMRLDPESLSPLSLDPLDVEVSRSMKDFNRSGYSDWGTSTCIQGETIYIPIPGYGIVKSEPGQRGTLLTEEKGLPTTAVSTMACQDGKYFLSINGGSALLEFNPESLETRQIFPDADFPYKNATVSAILADPERHALWVVLSVRTNRLLHLYQVDTRNGKMTRRSPSGPVPETPDITRQFYSPRYLWWQGNQLALYESQQGAVALIDPETVGVNWLCTTPQVQKWGWDSLPLPARYASDVQVGSAYSNQPRKVGVETDGGFVAWGVETNKDQVTVGFSRELVSLFYFPVDQKQNLSIDRLLSHDGQEVPDIKSIPDRPLCLQPGKALQEEFQSREIRGTMSTPNGLLILTSEKLYCLPEFALSRKSSPAAGTDEPPP